MQSIQTTGTAASQVSALFAHGEISFSLPKGATFADLAGSFEQLGDRRLGHTLAIFMKFNVDGQPVCSLRSGI